MTASILRPTAVLAGLLFLAGCATPPAKPVATFAPVAPADVESVPATPLDPALLNPPTEPFTLGPGDRIAIEILGDPATHAEVTVGPDGKIYYYLLPGLDVWGLSLGQARQRLAGELRRYLRLAPSVAVTLRRVQSKQVWILGRVNHPGAVGSGRTVLGLGRCLLKRRPGDQRHRLGVGGGGSQPQLPHSPRPGGPG